MSDNKNKKGDNDNNNNTQNKPLVLDDAKKRRREMWFNKFRKKHHECQHMIGRILQLSEVMYREANVAYAIQKKALFKALEGVLSKDEKRQIDKELQRIRNFQALRRSQTTQFLNRLDRLKRERTASFEMVALVVTPDVKIKIEMMIATSPFSKWVDVKLRTNNSKKDDLDAKQREIWNLEEILAMQERKGIEAPSKTENDEQNEDEDKEDEKDEKKENDDTEDEEMQDKGKSDKLSAPRASRSRRHTVPGVISRQRSKSSRRLSFRSPIGDKDTFDKAHELLRETRIRRHSNSENASSVVYTDIVSIPVYVQDFITGILCDPQVIIDRLNAYEPDNRKFNFIGIVSIMKLSHYSGIYDGSIDRSIVIDQGVIRTIIDRVPEIDVRAPNNENHRVLVNVIKLIRCGNKIFFPIVLVIQFKDSSKDFKILRIMGAITNENYPKFDQKYQRV